MTGIDATTLMLWLCAGGTASMAAKAVAISPWAKRALTMDRETAASILFGTLQITLVGGSAIASPLMAEPGAGPWAWTLTWPASNIAAMLALAVAELILDHKREEAAARAVNDVLKTSQARGAARAPIEVSVAYQSRLEPIQGVTEDDAARIEAAIRPVIGRGQFRRQFKILPPTHSATLRAAIAARAGPDPMDANLRLKAA